MVDATVLAAFAGFFGALVTLGIPLLGFLLRLDRRVGRALDLLLGKDDVDGDGILARLRHAEASLDSIETSLREAEAIEFQPGGVADE